MPEHALWVTLRLEQLLQKDSFPNGASFLLAKMARWLLVKKIEFILFFFARLSLQHVADRALAS